MESGMDFGELRQAPPTVQLRPDRNRHFAVAAIGQLAPDDLPIYIDLDVLRDTHEHAVSDTSVELGGVLLGGQYEDPDGQPFVVISDSLRASHYESTKGSFKFTHDTWSEITRQRDEFPAELQMVGWYHTHPGWGIFLSGMDLFICEHFFNRPLDVALVIDPCRGDRGMFQWTDARAQRTRQTKGFFVIASRFRADELQEYVDQLESDLVMPNDSRSRMAGWSSYPAPVVHVGDGRQGWMAVAVMGMLSAQFVLLALIAWKLLSPVDGLSPAGQTTEQLAGLQQRLDNLNAAREAELRSDAHSELLTALVSQFDDVPDDLVQSYEQQQQENAQLSAVVRGHLALEEQLRQEKAQLEAVQQRLSTKAKQREETLADQISALTNKNQQLRARNEGYVQRIALLHEELAKHDPQSELLASDLDDEEQVAAESSGGWNWTWIAIGGAAGALLIIFGAAAAVVTRKTEQPHTDRQTRDRPHTDVQHTDQEEEIR